MTVNIIHSDEPFVRISGNSYYVDNLDISIEDGALFIDIPNTNLSSDRDLPDSNAIFIGINQNEDNIVLTNLHTIGAQEPGGLSILTLEDNLVNLNINTSSMSVAVTNVDFVIIEGEVDSLELYVRGQSKIDVQAELQDARLSLFDDGEDPGSGAYNIAVFVIVSDRIEISGIGKPILYVMFSSPEIINNHEGNITISRFS